MRIVLFCDSSGHPVVSYMKCWLEEYILRRNIDFDIEIVTNAKCIGSGSILFLISCNQFISSEYRGKFTNVLVLHASDLPDGRGWNPHVWQFLEGKKHITVSLLEADEHIDSGDVWKKTSFEIYNVDLVEDINTKLFNSEFYLIEWAIENFETVVPINQVGKSSYYNKRTPEDSELNIDLPLKKLLPILRISDPDRYPAYFILEGVKFFLNISKESNIE